MKFDIDDEIRVGISRFTPIFKVVKFNSEYKVSWKGDVAHNGTTIEVSKTGSFNIDGRYIFKGLCSAKTAKRIIENRTMKQAIKMMADDIKEEIDKIKNAKISSLQ